MIFCVRYKALFCAYNKRMPKYLKFAFLVVSAIIVCGSILYTVYRRDKYIKDIAVKYRPISVENVEAGYRLTYPPAWSEVPQFINGKMIHNFNNDYTNGRTMMVGIVRVPERKGDLKDVTRQFLADSKRDNKNFSVAGKAKRIKVGTEDWGYFEGELSDKNVLTRNWTHSDPDLGALYVIAVFDTQLPISPIVEHEVQSMVDSIRFIRPSR